MKEEYLVKFKDIFSFATSESKVLLTHKQYETTLQQIKNKTIVVDKLINHIHVHLIIISIKLV